MKLGEFLYNVRIELREPIEGNWQDKQLIGYINDTIRYDIAPIASQKGIFSLPVTSNSEYVDLPTNLLIPISGEWSDGSNKNKVEIGSVIGDEVFSDIKGTPRNLWLFNNKLRIYPIPIISGTLKIRGILRPNTLVELDDQCEYTDVDEIVKCGTVYRALLFDKDPIADVWLRRLDRAKYLYMETRIKQPEKEIIEDYWGNLSCI